MTQPKNAMEIFTLLDKSNCKECGEKTCLAFAGAVFQGRRRLADCPRIEPETAQRYTDTGKTEAANPAEAEREAYMEKLRAEVRRLDFSEAAQRTGGRLTNGRLVLKVLGKDFGVDKDGRLSADIHVNPWVAGPFLSHILYGRGADPSGRWVPFRELDGGKERYPLFQKRCEEPLKQLADTLPDFFEDIIHMFSGKQVAEEFESDVSVVLHPLPKVPLMICYWKAEEGLFSSLNLFFDKTADVNLDTGSVFSLGAGIAQMFTKLAQRHGFSNEVV
jgi:hypothetical protein